MSASIPTVVQPVRPADAPAPALPPELSRLLRRAGRRLRLDRALAGAALGLGAGLVAAFVLAVAVRIRPLMLPEEAAYWSLGLGAAGLALGTLVGMLWPAPRRAIAVRADRVLGLKERVSTAIELHALPDGGVLAVDQIRDAVAAAGAIERLPRLGPALDRRILASVGGLAVLVALALRLPNPQSDTVRERREAAEQVEAAREEVEAIAAAVAARTDLDPATQEAMLARLDALAEALDPGEMNGEEAQAEIAAAEGDLQRLEDAAAPEQARALREAAPILQTSGATAEVGNALAAGDLPAAAEAMAELGERVDDLSPEEQQALANRLNELAALVQATNPELAAALAAAAANLAAGETAAAAASLAQAGAEVGDVAAALAASDAVTDASASLASTRSRLAYGDLDPSDGASSGSDAAGSATPRPGRSERSSTPGASGSGPSTPGAGDGQSGGGQGSGGGQSGSQQGAGSGSGAASGQLAGSSARTSSGGTASGNAQPLQGEPGSEGSREEEPVYAPAAEPGQTGDEEFLPGQESEGNSETRAQVGAGVATDATVPYSAVYGEYAQEASRDLEQGAVPAPLQPYVRDYFSALEPAADEDDEEQAQ